MSIKTCLKRFIIFSFYLTLVYASDAQVVWDTLPYKQFADFKLQNLNKSIIPTGILYDRVMPMADIERYKQLDQFTNTTGPRHWMQAYYELINASYSSTGWTSLQQLDDAVAINPSLDNGIPIGILNFK